MGEDKRFLTDKDGFTKTFISGTKALNAANTESRKTGKKFTFGRPNKSAKFFVVWEVK